MAKKSNQRKPIAVARAAQASIKPQPTAHELTLLSEAEARTRRSRYTIWRQVKAGQFPKPINSDLGASPFAPWTSTRWSPGRGLPPHETPRDHLWLAKQIETFIAAAHPAGNSCRGPLGPHRRRDRRAWHPTARWQRARRSMPCMRWDGQVRGQHPQAGLELPRLQQGGRCRCPRGASR
jgi:hypothetical protein